MKYLNLNINKLQDYGWMKSANSDTENNFFKHWNIQNKLANFDSTQTNL